MRIMRWTALLLLVGTACSAGTRHAGPEPAAPEPTDPVPTVTATVTVTAVPAPATSSPFADERPASITVRNPVAGGEVGRVFTAVGRASTFEANVGIKVLDESGTTVVHTSATATAAAPEWGDWRIEITLPQPGTYYFVAFEASAMDGSITYRVSRTIHYDG
jgi:hypothetical protein